MTAIHIVAKSHRARAEIAGYAFSRGMHAEIFEGARELLRAMPRVGLVLVEDAEADEILTAKGADVLPLPVVVYSEEPRTHRVVNAMRAGASDYVEWPIKHENLSSYVEGLLLAEAESIRVSDERRKANSKLCTLSPREREVLELIVEGHSNKGVAHELGISSRTVEVHRASVMRKLGARTVSEAVRIALSSRHS